MGQNSEVVVFVDFFEPGYAGGGPIRSISNLTKAMSEFRFTVATRDRDLGDVAPYPQDLRIQDESVDVQYLNVRNPSFLLRVPQILCRSKCSTVYLNSFFSPCFTILPLILMMVPAFRPRKVVLAPRGELSKGALSLSPTRKRLYILAFKACLARRVMVMHATDESERLALGSLFPRIPVVTAGNLPAKPGSSDKSNVDSSTSPGWSFVYLGRISPKKNIHRALKAFREVEGDYKFTICGPASDPSYMNLCQRLGRDDARVAFAPGLENSRVHAFLQSHDAMLHPSLNENFGHSIFEALSAGLPVVAGPGGPWSKIPGAPVETVDPESVESIRDAILRVVTRLRKDSEDARRAARNTAREYYDSMNLSVYSELLSPTTCRGDR